MTEQGKPLFDGLLQYCTRCCMPETQEGVSFDELGVCTACRASEQKMHINWAAREVRLREILEQYKSVSGNNYDCLLPISGGKDSTFQMHVLTKIYGLKPLAVTFSHNWYSKTGLYNLYNSLEKFEVDHIMFTPNRGLVNKLARRSLAMIGDSCWHCHMGVGAFPLQIAVRFGIKLLVWGESLSEADGRATYFDGVTRYDRDYFTKVSARHEADAMINDYLTAKDVYPFQLPTHEEIDRAGIVGIHLGDFIFWDDERQTEFVKRAYAWREDYVEGTYKCYKSVECIMAGVHDYSKFIKRGFGRGTDHASQDVRAGLLTREEGFDLAKQADLDRPKALDYYLDITGFDEQTFVDTLVAKRDETASKLPVVVAPPKAGEKPLRPAIVEMVYGTPAPDEGPREPISQYPYDPAQMPTEIGREVVSSAIDSSGTVMEKLPADLAGNKR